MKPWGAAEENAGPGRLRRLVMRRFRHLEAYVRQFARFKMILDPMFKMLCDLAGPAESVLDVGCGYGVPGAFLLARYPRMRIHGWEPDPHRVRIAGRVYGDRGVVSLGAAPGLPVEPEEVDLVLMLDMAHYLNDEQLSTTLAEVKNRLGADGRLLMRITVPGVDRIPMARRLDNLASRIARRPVPIYRPATVIRDSLERAGFKVVTEEASAPGREETWFLALPGA